MLQARQIACILLFLAGTLPAGGVYAQDPEEREASPDFKRIGAEPVENEPVLDLSLPQPEKKPETAEQRAERLRRQRQAAIEAHLAAANEAMQAGRVDQPRKTAPGPTTARHWISIPAAKRHVPVF